MVHLIQEYLTNSVKNYPDEIAVSCREDSITYRELDEQTNMIAHEFKTLEITRGQFVPIFIHKSINSLLAIFAILKSDCAYVPIDTESPADRICQILEATNADTVVVDNETASLFESLFADAAVPVNVLNIDEIHGARTDALEYENLSIDVAYALFTSGSTGAPKGVMISHQMIVDYIDWCVDTYGIKQQDRVANHAPLYFDNSTFDIYVALSTGAQLHLVHDELNQIMPKLITWLQDRKITVFFCVPSVLSILKRTKRVTRDRLGSLRHVIAAGEVLPPEVVSFWMEQLPEAQFTNMYGPTEITVDCTFHVLNAVPGEEGVPIGKSRRNMEVFVRVADGSLTNAPGAEGEIAVRGKSVSYGYLNNPEKTAGSFVQNPDHDLYHDPIYLTGDYGRFAEDAVLFYLGRIDQQIKYMGNRIELGEIEAAIRKIDGVVDTAVVFHDDPNLDDKFIGALVVAEEVSVEEIGAFLQNHLPVYMVPKKINTVADLPRTANGKTDRKRALSILVG